MVKTTTKGIFQSDVIVRSALVYGLDDLRNNPWLLDFAFASLAQDDLTRAEYGEKMIEEAKNWFLSTDLPVSMGFRFDQIATPLIVISLEDTNEAATTLGDIHSSPTEDVDATEIVINPAPILKFTPKSYDSTTGLVTLPDDLSTANVFAGMVFYDTKSNEGYKIAEVVDDSSFTIDPGIKANFTKAVVAPRSSFYVAHLESLEEREQYRVDLYVSGNPAFLLYLYAIVKFVLLRYKEDLLEARGLERTQVNSTGLRLFQPKEAPEIIYTRAFTITGYVRQYWPKTVKPKIDGIFAQIDIQSPSTTPDAIAADVEQQDWDMEGDQFGEP